ncbi:MAG: hypothetical protein ACD_43C00265G0004 [uncultured bacterium]|nr:MAG: hypothetical protein ACD_43C00265G0004 [uncultured bacterium]
MSCSNTEPVVVELHSEYILHEEDRALISAFEFRLTNSMWMLDMALDWLKDCPHSPKIVANITQFDRYFRAPRQAIIETVPRLAASKNRDIRALVPPLNNVVTQLDDLTQRLSAYLAQPAATEAAQALYEAYQTIYAKVLPLSEAVGNNPAYRAYKKYIKENQLEDSRVTLDFELEYSEEVE